MNNGVIVIQNKEKEETKGREKEQEQGEQAGER